MVALVSCHRHRGVVKRPRVQVSVTHWPARAYETRSDLVTEVALSPGIDAAATVTVVDAHDGPLSPVIPFERSGGALRALIPHHAIAPHRGPARLRIRRGAIVHVELAESQDPWDAARIAADDPQATLTAVDAMRGNASEGAVADALLAEAAFALGRTRLAEIFASRGIASKPAPSLERRLLRVRIVAVAEGRGDPRDDRARLDAIASPEELALDRALDLRLAELHDRNESGPRMAPEAARALLAVESSDAAMLCRAGAIERGRKLAVRIADKAICLVRAGDAATDDGKLGLAETLYAEARALLGDRFLPREQREAWYSAAYLAEQRGDLETAFERSRTACTWVDRLMTVERDLSARDALSGNVLSYFVAAERFGLLAKREEAAIAVGELGKGRLLAALLRGKSGVDINALGAWFDPPSEELALDLSAARARLAADDVVLTYARLGHNAAGVSEVAIGVVTRDSVSGTVAAVPEDLAQLIESHARAVASADGERARTLGQRLESILIAPVRDRLRARVLVSPHLALHGVAWPALHDGERFLIERHAIARIPPLPSYRPQPSPKPVRWTTAIAPPHPPLGALPGFDAIADGLVSAIRPTVDLRGRAATVERLLGSLGEADALLYAGHARFDSDAPLRSALLVSNGEIRATDLLRLRHPLEIVILVGCETGRTVKGKSSFADEAIGLPRAFLAGGARQVVGALLEVMDRDAEDFTRALLMSPSSGDLSRDVARAQRCMISGPCASRGAAWGTYVVDLR